ncbi:VOC family protein [Deinococcus phoenicis]|uniref:VOC family protein n=1 Tax=Deinococcus phoenicis TaxID=1476583 RepID=UPI0004B06743|nr:VOC family protein [Deinococcus phoenicis]
MDNAVHELRLVITTQDYERSKAFYQALLGTSAVNAWESSEGRVIILEAGRATLEIVDERHAGRIDEIEVGRRVSGELRLALGMPDSKTGATTAQQVGGVLTHPVTRTPWNSLNARVLSPDGLQITLFAENE